MNKFFDYGYDDIQCDVKLPLPIIKEHDGINVVRDDLLDGGTKRRSHLQCMSFHSPDTEEFVYFTKTRLFQLSFKLFCKDLGRKCTVTVPKGEKTWLTIESERLESKCNTSSDGILIKHTT